MFEDLSRLIGHVHHEESFDDFDRQPVSFRRSGGVIQLNLDVARSADYGFLRASKVAAYPAAFHFTRPNVDDPVGEHPEP